METIARAKMRSSGKSTWGIKLQRKIQDIDVYSRVWPTARFIHIIRDGRDVAASHLRTVPDWGYKSIEDTAYLWSNLIRATRLRAPQGRYLEVAYEQLVTGPATVCRAICDFLELPFDPAMTRHHEGDHSLHAHTWSHPSAVATARPVTTGSIGRYVDDLVAADVSAFEDTAGATLLGCGYPLGGDLKSRQVAAKVAR